MKIILVIIGALVLYFVIGYTLAVLNIVALPLFTLNTKIQANKEIINKTFNADNQIYNYHWFQERAGEIDAEKAQATLADKAVVDYDTSAGPRVGWGFEEKQEDARLRAVAQGLHNNVESLIKEYNARAGEADRSIFINGLKTFIPLN